jgi:fructose-bisphosphate aldolase class II
VIRKIATQNKSEFDPRKFLKPAMDAMATLCADRLERFGAAGNAARIKPLSLAAMSQRYHANSLDPVIG